MLHLLIFIFFNLFFLFLGRGVVLIISKFYDDIVFDDNQKVFDTPIFILYPLIGLFLMGNASFIFNFFSKNNNFILKIFFLVVVLLNIFNKPVINKELRFFINFILIPSILSISSITIGFAYDAGLYQLNNQYWIRESVIPFGLSNLHSRYGYSSIIEYINANVWYYDNVELIHLTNLVFISFFFSFISYHFLNSKNSYFKISSIFIILFGILDNFGFGGGRNGFIDIESASKQDTPFSIVFLVTSLFVIYSITNKKISSIELTLVLILSLFSVQLRIFGLTLAIILFYLIIKNGLLNKRYLYIYIPQILLGVLWIVKNIFLTSCLFYPIETTCIKSLKWYTKNSAGLELKELKSFHVSYELGEPFSEWFLNWSQKEININTFKNFVISLFIIFLIKILFIDRNFNLNVKHLNKFIYFYSFLILITWIVSSPGIRLGLGIFNFYIALIGVKFRSFRFKLLNNRYLKMFLLTSCIFLLPRFDNYIEITNNLYKYNQLKPPQIEYKKTEGYGVIPINGSQCWVKLDCIQTTYLVKRQFFYKYQVFYIEE